jgi:uncharacterized protein
MREVLTGLAERRLGEVVEARLAEEPVVVLNGPRTVGKSTLLSELAGRLGRAVIDCDDLATRAAVRSDPARFVESDQPVLIDEYQHVPELQFAGWLSEAYQVGAGTHLSHSAEDRP